MRKKKKTLKVNNNDCKMMGKKGRREIINDKREEINFILDVKSSIFYFFARNSFTTSKGVLRYMTCKTMKI